MKERRRRTALSSSSIHSLRRILLFFFFYFPFFFFPPFHRLYILTWAGLYVDASEKKVSVITPKRAVPPSAG